MNEGPNVSIIKLIKDNKVFFSYFRKNVFYYSVKYEVDGNWYQFPVPLEDIQDATLLAEDKAIMFLRYIRKAIVDKTFTKMEV